MGQASWTYAHEPTRMDETTLSEFMPMNVCQFVPMHMHGPGELEFEEIVVVLKKQMAAEKWQSRAEKDEGRKKKGVSMAALFDVEVEEEADGGMASMVMHEFIHALIRIAWECYPIEGEGIGKRLGTLLERALLPGVHGAG